MNRDDPRVQALLKAHPTAIDIRLAGDCHCGAPGSLLFFWLPSLGEERRSRYIVAKDPDPNAIRDGDVWIDTRMITGGYFCSDCGFSNAGSMRLDDYDAAEKYIL